ncbi:MAG: hypothetical protein SO106_00395 [Candidatus Onthovivens sp.]|nr:hypothetical protein [Candidatus Onthovivens sp.]
MKIKMYKTDDGIIAKIIDNEKELEFSNLDMIDYLYKTNTDIEFEYDDISEEEKTKIVDLYNKIKAKVLEIKNEDSSIECDPK